MDFKNNRSTIFISLTVCILFLTSCIFFMFEIKGNSKVKSVKKERPPIKKVSFVGVGDNLIHDSIFNCADRKSGVFGDGKYDFTSLYSEIKKDINKYDIRYINQESIIAGDKYGIHNYPRFNTPEIMIPTLVNTGFNLINLANNHSMDMGSQGIKDSLDLWKKENVYKVGLYKSQEERDKPLIIEKNGLKIAVLSYTYGTNGMTPNKDYSIPYLDEEKIKKDLERAKKEADFSLVSVHWGDENYHSLNQEQIKFAKLFNDLGVDLVLGSHAHVIQKAQWLKNQAGKKTLVFYGTGNFVHNMLGADTYLEGMASWTFVKDGEKKYIENAKFTPLVFHLERNQYGLDGKVYRLDKYPLELANKHFAMHSAGQYHLNNYKKLVKTLIPKDLLDLKLEDK